MKSIYDVTYEEVTKGLIFVKSEDELKNKGALLIGYTDEYYDASTTGFFSHRIYELDGKKYITGDGWKFRDQ